MLALVMVIAGNDAICSMSMHHVGGARDNGGCARAHRGERLHLSCVTSSLMPTFTASSASHELYIGAGTSTLLGRLLMVKAGGILLMSAICRKYLQSQS